MNHAGGTFAETHDVNWPHSSPARNGRVVTRFIDRFGWNQKSVLGKRYQAGKIAGSVMALNMETGKGEWNRFGLSRTGPSQTPWRRDGQRNISLVI
jgi:hypothetical protein